MVAVILAGGRGTRLWPESRQYRPKQLCKLIAGRSMLDHTIDRLEAAGFAQILIITSQELLTQVEEIAGRHGENKRLCVLAEPEAKGTAPALGLALAQRLDCPPEEIIGVFPADHHISDRKAFNKAIRRSAAAAECSQLVTIGVPPSRPETGYGYIEKARYEFSQLPGVYPVESFREKPDQRTADSYLASGKYSWNSGIYMATRQTFMEEFKKHLPALYTYIRQGDAAYREAYRLLPEISLDYGIAEKSYCTAVVAGEFDWCDLGSWDSLGDLLPADPEGNTIQGEDALALNSQRCMVRQTDKTVVLYNVKDLLVVESDHVILVADRLHMQDIRKLVGELERQERYDLL
jgi:mannose-1-phosphate guanylyltransferase/mannose-6-phosphate isomerase